MGLLNLTMGFVFVNLFDLRRLCSFVSCSISVLELRLLINSRSEVSVSKLFFSLFSSPP